MRCVLMVRPPTRIFSDFSPICWPRRGRNAPHNRTGSKPSLEAILGGSYSEGNAAPVKDDFQKWVEQFGEFMDKSLPTGLPWGPGRLDAFA